VIPVEVTQTPWHYTTLWDWLDHWQTLIAGGFALLAGFVTVVATMIIANRQIAASREEAKRVIAATREQTSVTGEQTSTTVRLERERVLSEDRAFRAMLEAAMARVLAEAVENHAHAMALHFLYYNFASIRRSRSRQRWPLA
jgi:hypothetical protein